MPALFSSPGRPGTALAGASETRTGSWLAALGTAWETSAGCARYAPSQGPTQPGQGLPGKAQDDAHTHARVGTSG